MNFVAFIFYLLTLTHINFADLPGQCKQSTLYWKSLQLPYSNIQKFPEIKSNPPQTCPQIVNKQCCDNQMYTDMSRMSNIKLKEMSTNQLETLLIMFSNDSYSLMNIYRNDLEETKKQLNKLFSTTYGYNYKIHRQFFYSWFDKLQLYMQGKLHNINQLLQNFLLEMAQRIVRILIPPGVSPRLTACHTAKLIESRPYQNTDVSLKDSIAHSYPLARLVVNALAVGRDAIKTLMLQTSPSSKCIEKFNSAFHCMVCQGLMLKTCPNTCQDIMADCFGSFSKLELMKVDKVFNNYINALVKLASRLDNSFNFHQVNHKMSVQISTAIMSVQQTYPTVKQEIIKKCSRITSKKRKKREASDELVRWMNLNKKSRPTWEKKLESNANNYQYIQRHQANNMQNDQSKPNDLVSPFARRLKQRYSSLKNYFANVPNTYCSEVAEKKSKCWNGTAVVNNFLPSMNYDQPKPKKKGKKKVKISNPELANAVKQVQKITKKINGFLENKNDDPKTVDVAEYTLYKTSRPERNNPNKQSVPEEVIEGSGFPERLPFPRPPRPQKPQKPNKPKLPSQPKPQLPIKPQRQPKQPSELPDIEGSGQDPNKNTDNSKNKFIPPINPPTKEKPFKTSTINSKLKFPSIQTSTTPVSLKKLMTTKRISISPNQIPDDEDLNPPVNPNPNTNTNPNTNKTPLKPPTLPKPEENKNSIEGSGKENNFPINQRKIPNTNSNKITQPPKPFNNRPQKPPKKPPTDIEGSGNNPRKPQMPDIEDPKKPKKQFPNKNPNLPMLPTKQNVPITPEPVGSDLEGSGSLPTNNNNRPVLDPNIYIPEKNRDLGPDQPRVRPNPNTKDKNNNNNKNNNNFNNNNNSSKDPLEYPGKIPPDVWMPEVAGARKDNRGLYTTPGSSGMSLFSPLDVQSLFRDHQFYPSQIIFNLLHSLMSHYFIWILSILITTLVLSDYIHNFIS